MRGFFPVITELLLFLVVIIPCITFLTMTEHILLRAVIPSIYLKILSVSRSLVDFLTFCNRIANFTATVVLEFSGMQQGIYIIDLENPYLFFYSAFNTAYSSN